MQRDVTSNKLSYPLAMDNWDDRERVAIERVVKSNRFTMGEQVKLFESEVAAKFGSRYAVMVNSGSSANLIMLTAAKIFLQDGFGKKPNIVVPAVSWSTTYTPAYYLGYELKFTDIDSNHFGLSVENVEKAVDENTVAILTVNLLGSASDLTRLKSFAEKRKILLLEDNCESLGAELDGHYTGTFGLMGTHSSFFSHHINTMEGGWVTTDNEEVYQILVSLRAHGWSRELPPTSRFRTPGAKDWFTSQFEFVMPGMNFRPLEMEAAIGRVQLSKVDQMIEQRRQNADVFIQHVGSLPSVTIQRPLGESSWFAFAIIFKNSQIRGQVAEVLRDAGVECRPIVTGNFTRQPVLNYLNYEVSGNLEVADKLHDCGMYIGNHPLPLSREITQTATLIEDAVK
ncbi:MAG: aminotransferase class I/II-fold pyridoxal phosphate-dependent enzyme [Candidatus Nanopelagicaceae bacterium]